ncbi:ROK family protein [Lentibacillus saliphilus]|uniref:ROK family protein n=1 Tax=Lentibacillus saliphilus TaxID=2737028 RepID=UPI001C2FDED4|nr:ROK family protein [Lentibacillus saliphilus]
MKRGTFQLMKSVNKSLILNTIRTSEPISRAQIAKKTELTPPTVSSIVKELLEEELVVESDLGESQGGRKPTMLLINHDAFYVIGVDVSPDSIKCIAGSLSGKVIVRAEPKEISKRISSEQFLDELIDTIRSVLDTLSTPDKVMGIGVAMHGVVDVENGLSLVAPNLGLTDIPIKDVLEKEFDTIVKVENDVRAMALGESWFSTNGHIGSMLTVNMGSGVGAGLVIDGKLYHGAADLAGEVGHMTIDLHGEVCTCGNRGCFQTFATCDAIIKRAKAALIEADEKAGMAKGEAEHLVHDQIGYQNLTIEDIYHMATAGNEILANVLQETGEVIGIALTNLIHVINPEKIVLGGEVCKMSAFILPVIKDTIVQRGLTADAKQTKVDLIKLGHDATLKGALALLLVEIFE